MSLDETLVPIDFGMGIDEGADSKQIQPGKLLGLHNIRIDKAKQLSKRYGYANANIVGDVLDCLDTRPFVHNALATDAGANPQTIIRSGTNSANSSASYFRNIDVSVRGRITAGVGSGSGVIEQTLVDSATANGITIAVWEQGANVVFVGAYDEATGQLLNVPQLVTTASRPRVLYTLGGFVMGSINSTANTLEIRNISATGAVSSVNISYTLVSVANPQWDWAPYGTNSAGFLSNGFIVAAYNSSTATTISVVLINSTGSTAVTRTSTTISASGTNAICVCTPYDSTNSTIVRILWHESVGGLQLRYFDISGGGTSFASGTYGGTTRVLNASTTLAENIGACENTTLTGFDCLTQYTAAQTYFRSVAWKGFTDGSPPTGTGTHTQLTVGLASKPINRNGLVYAWTAHDSPLQRCYFFHMWNSFAGAIARVSGRMFYGVGGGLTAKPLLPSLTALDTTRYVCAMIARTRVFVSNGSLQALRVLAEGVVDFKTLGTNRSVEAEGSKLITGGILGQYDAGGSIVEYGFLLYPEGLTVATSTSGSNLADGSYQLVAVYEWTDNKGKLHRSTPSVPITAVVSGGGGAGGITLTVPNLGVTLKDAQLVDGRNSLFITTYRTVANGSVFYRSSSQPVATFNATVGLTVVIAETFSDAVLISHEILYTQGGILPYAPPDGPTAIASNGERVFCNDPVDDGVVWYSNKFITGEGVQFSQSLYQRIPDFDGPITAIACLTGNIVIFKEFTAYAITGDGPDPTGQSDTFSTPEQIPTDGGCRRQSACVVTPHGAVVYSDRGFHLLGNDLSWSYIGKTVKDFETQDVRSAHHLPTKKECRFVMTGGVILHWNYEYPDPDGSSLGQWYQSDFSALDAVQTQDNNFYVLESTTRTMFREDNTRFTDQGLGTSGSDRQIPLTIETAWIQLAGINGYQRVWSIFLLGSFKSAHNLTIQFAYDHLDTWYSVTSTFAGATIVAGTVAYRVRIDPPVQKCTAIRIRITDDGTGESLNLTGMTVSVGVKRGGSKLRSSNKVV